MKTATLIAAALTLAMSPALAGETYQFTRTVSDDAVSKVADKADIIGIRAGMTADEVRAIFAAEYPDTRIDTFSITFGTPQVRSEPFPIVLETDSMRKAGATEVHLTSPIAGSRVFAARRKVEFKIADGLPKLEALKAQLVQKYGEPSLVEEQYRKMFWYFGGRGECTGNNVCRSLYDGGISGGVGGVTGAYDISKADQYDEATGYGTDIVVAFDYWLANDYPDSVQRFSVSFVDLNLRAASARADADLLMAKQAEFDRKGVALPKL